MSRPAPELSVVIPAFNEESRLAGTLEAVNDYFLPRVASLELIVVDDGSSDRTVEVAEGFLDERNQGRVVCLDRNRGKGGALKVGMCEARGDWVLMMDADLSTPLDSYEAMRPHFGARDVVIGSRRREESKIVKAQPFYRRFMGRVFTMISNLIILSNVSDYTCGFKAFRHDAARRIFGLSRIAGWGYDVEVVFLALRLGYRLQEIAVLWENDPRSRVRIVSATLSSFVELLRIRAYDFLGFYRRRVPGSAE